MASMAQKEKYITCPYEKSHQILAARLQFHLVKCEYVNKNAKFVLCPFNATHKVREPELKCHVMYMCPDKGKIDNYLCSTNENSKPLIPVQKIEIKHEYSENWDDVQEESYVPEEHILNKPILLAKQGATPSERKAFQAAERQRLQQLLGVDASTNKTEKQPKTPQKQSMRLPSTAAKSSAIVEEPPQPIANLGQEDTLTTNMQGMSLDSFEVPKYSRGRGRGRARMNY